MMPYTYSDNASLAYQQLGGSALIAPFLPIILAAFLLFVIIGIAVYVYTSFAYMSIARKARQKTPGLAWIPGIGPNLIAFKAAKMHWWPWLLIIGFFIPFLNVICILLFVVFSVIWRWKLLEAIGKPGWWSILMLIPIVGLIMLGIAAWSKK